MSPSNSLCKLIVIDDNEFIRKKISQYFHSEKSVICMKACSTIQSATEYLNTANGIDIILLDNNLFGHSSLSSITVFLQQFPDLKIIIYTVYEDREFLLKALRLGAAGYILKNTNFADLERDIKSIANGHISITPKMAYKLIEFYSQESQDSECQVSSLTSRELKTLELLSEGYEYDEIAEALEISVNGVRSHIRKIYKKLQVKNSVQAAKIYWENKTYIIDKQVEGFKSCK